MFSFKRDSGYNGWIGALVVAALGGMVTFAAYAWRVGPHAGRTVAAGILVAGAFLLVGGLTGFLFGIPRTLQNDLGGPTAATTSDNRPRDRAAEPGYRANTNLEQISDWLTKMLVGVGLTQLTALPSHLGRLSRYLGPSLCDGPVGETFALAMVLYFTTCGFLFGYLWTRLFLMGAMARADAGAVGLLEAKVDKQVEQANRDARALQLVEQHLTVSSDIEPVADKTLEDAIGAAGPQVKAQIFYRATGIRARTWQNPSDKPQMERTIPVFRALIAASPGRYHMNYGQLGFALKDHRAPDWAGAEQALSVAIDLRDRESVQGWTMYEFNRAVCRIQLDANFANKQPSAAESRRTIVGDLQVVARSDHADVLAVEPVAEWLKLNEVTRAILTG